MEFESLIFDIDGTLWDSRAMVAEGYNIQLHEEGLDHLAVTKDDLTPLFGKVKEELADALFATIGQPERYDLINRCMDMERRHMAASECAIGFPAVKETLEKLAEKYRLFIVSNCDRGYPELCMEKLDMAHLFQGHLCYGDTGTPKGETIRRLMEKNGIENAAYIGDTQGDLEASEDAGIPFIFCAFGFGDPDHYFAKIHQFEDLLKL